VSTFFKAVIFNNLDWGRVRDPLYFRDFDCSKLLSVIEYFGGLKRYLPRINPIVFRVGFMADEVL
jgi:hypothetical protein